MELNRAFTSVERSFNVAASIPVVGIFSSMARATVAQVQVVAGVALAAVGLVGRIFSSSETTKRLTEKGVTHIVQGALNVVRAVGEFILGCTFIGSFALLAVQSSRQERFEPFVSYDKLPGQLGFQSS